MHPIDYSGDDLHRLQMLQFALVCSHRRTGPFNIFQKYCVMGSMGFLTLRIPCGVRNIPLSYKFFNKFNIKFPAFCVI